MRAGLDRESCFALRLAATDLRRLAAALLACGVQLANAAQQGPVLTPANGPCSARQLILVGPQEGWSCRVDVAAHDTFVVRVDQRDVDVVVSLHHARGQPTLSVDSPTRRASAEILLIGPRLSGTYTLVVRPKAGVASAQRALLVMDRFSGPAAVLTGLAELTAASFPDERQTAESGKLRIVQLQPALLKFQSAGVLEWQGETLLRMAATYFWSVNDWAAAALNARLAMNVFSQLDDGVLHAQASVLRAASLVEILSSTSAADARTGTAEAQSPLDEPIGLGDAAALALQNAGLRYGQAQALNFAGIGLFYQGKYSVARARYDQAAAIFRSLGEEASAALPLQNVAHIDLDSGDYTKAIASFKAVLEVLDPNANAEQYVTVLINLGTAQYVMGQFEAALRSLTMALEICDKRSFAAERARSLHSLGMVYLVIGDRDRAQIFLERALELRRPLASQNPRGLQTSLIRVGDLRRERGEIRGALTLHAEALERALSATQKARALYAVGLDHEQSGAFATAAQAYKDGLALDLPQDFPVRVALLGVYGALQVRGGDSSGRTLVERAAQLHEAHGDVDHAAENYIVLAEADRQRQQLTAALRHAQKAVALYESQRLGAVNPDLRATYLAHRADASELLGEIYMTLWERSSNAREKERLAQAALLAAEVGRQRALEDFRSIADGTSGQPSSDAATLDAHLSAKRHRLATLLEQQSPRADMMAALRRDISLLRTQIDLAQAKPLGTTATPAAASFPKSVAEIQRTLQPDETVLVYQLGIRQSQSWAVTRESISFTPLSGRARLEDAARQLYHMWSTPAARVDAERERAASRVVLGEKTPWLRPEGTVVVVADGILRSLPFGALLVENPDGMRQRIASTQQVLFRSTSRRAATDMAQTAAGATNRILLVGDPTSARPSSTNPAVTDPWAQPPLPGARREVQDIAGIAAGWRSYVLLGAQATKPALLSMPLDTFRTIHFATHARLDIEDPQLSSIALSSRDPGTASASSMLTVREIVGFKLSAETVVLSACEASLGKSYRGQLSFGLSEAFLLAGAHNVLGSLWKVSDEGAQQYMRRFYEAYIRSNESPAAAARVAALQMSSNPAFAHPYFWAAFAVTQR